MTASSISKALKIFSLVSLVAVAVSATRGTPFTRDRISFILENHLWKACSPFLAEKPHTNVINSQSLVKRCTF